MAVDPVPSSAIGPSEGGDALERSRSLGSVRRSTSLFGWHHHVCTEYVGNSAEEQVASARHVGNVGD